MRSMWISFVCFAVFLTVPCKTTDGWNVNVDVMDFAIGIYYNPSLYNKDYNSLNLDRVEILINDLANIFRLGKDKTRMAIVEFGDTPIILLPIQDGINAAAVAQACTKLGKRPLNTNRRSMSLRETAVETHRMVYANATDRIEVPKLITVIGSTRGGGMSDKMFDADDPIGAMGAHLFYMQSMEKTGGLSNPYKSIMTYEIVGSGTKKTKFRTDIINESAPVVAENTRSSLALCVFKKSLSECYVDKTVNECVADVFYDLAYKDDNGKVHPSRWREVEWYCFKNGSTASCPSGPAGCQTAASTSKTTTTTTTMTLGASTSKTTTITKTTQAFKRPTAPTLMDDSNIYYPDDPIVVNLKNALIGLSIFNAILLPTTIAAIVYVVRLRRQVIEEAKKQQKPFSVVSWTINMPPEVTQTSPDDLVKRYAAKKA